LLDLITQLSDVEIGHGVERSSDPNAAGVSRDVVSRAVDDDDDEEDDNAFTHSGALTIKSCHYSPDSSFTDLDSHPLESAELQSTQGSRLEPSANSDETSNSGSVSTEFVDCSQQSAAVLDRVTAASNSDSDLRAFLSELGLAKYVDVFYEQDVDLPMFLTLNEDDLKEIGIRYQPL